MAGHLALLIKAFFWFLPQKNNVGEDKCATSPTAALVCLKRKPLSQPLWSFVPLLAQPLEL